MIFVFIYIKQHKALFEIDPIDLKLNLAFFGSFYHGPSVTLDYFFPDFLITLFLRQYIKVFRPWTVIYMA